MRVKGVVADRGPIVGRQAGGELDYSCRVEGVHRRLRGRSNAVKCLKWYRDARGSPVRRIDGLGLALGAVVEALDQRSPKDRGVPEMILKMHGYSTPGQPEAAYGGAPGVQEVVKEVGNVEQVLLG